MRFSRVGSPRAGVTFYFGGNLVADRRRRGDGYGATGRIAAHHEALRRLHEEDAHPWPPRLAPSDMGLNVTMMGPPGAGKGTQAGRFASDRGLPKISTGDILREAIREKNHTALEAKARMDSGELVDDATDDRHRRGRLARPDVSEGFVLDGFPRTVAQARALDEMMDRLDWTADRRRRSGTGTGAGAASAIRRICSVCGPTPTPRTVEACGKCDGHAGAAGRR